MKLLRGSSIGEFALSDRTARVGVLEYERGERLPVSGLASHDEDEIAFVLSGVLKGFSGGLPFTAGAGETMFIPAGEAHWAIVLERARIVYVLVPTAATPPEVAADALSINAQG